MLHCTLYGRKSHYYFLNNWRKSCFALRSGGDSVPSGTGTAFGDPLFPTAGKVGKRAGRNQWFLHFLARYAFSDFDTVCHTFAQNVSYRFVIESSLLQRRCRWLIRRKRFGVYRREHERQRRKKKADSSFTAKLTVFCERAVKDSKYAKGIAWADS